MLFWIIPLILTLLCGCGDSSDLEDEKGKDEILSSATVLSHQDCCDKLPGKDKKCGKCQQSNESGTIVKSKELSEKEEMDKLHWQYTKTLHDKFGDLYVVPNIGLEMLWVQPGSFKREKKQEKHIYLGFYLGKYEVSQVQWEAVMRQNPSRFKGPDRPVEQISWEDAVTFCEKLTQVEIFAGRLPNGVSYQLPNNVEWEYACRAGTSSLFFWGESPATQYANYDDGDSVRETKKVNSYSPNPWGFFNMHGNCWEFCSDISDENSLFRFARGGSWSDASDFMHSAYRYQIERDSNYNNLGIRLALKVDRMD